MSGGFIDRNVAVKDERMVLIRVIDLSETNHTVRVAIKSTKLELN